MKHAHPIRVLFLAAEAAPLAAAGGLADVVGSLPKALAQLNIDVRVMLPRYSAISTTAFRIRDTRIHVPIFFDGIRHVVRVFRTTLPKSRVPVYLLDHPHYEGAGDIYFQDVTNAKEQQQLQTERFLFLTASAKEVLKKTGWIPDLVHFHDWHTSAAPLFFSCPTIATIHNLALQGTLPVSRFTQLFNPTLAKRVPRAAFTGPSINLTRLGLITASVITTVSPTYAKEILTKSLGAGCDDILRRRRRIVFGILNGVDTTTYDPRHDRAIFPYGPTTLMRKTRNTARLRQMFRFTNNGPVLGVVSRLTEQKGIELICSAAKQLVQWGMNLVVLGTGTPRHEAMVRQCARRFPTAIATRITFDPVLARQIYAGSNAFLMPSRFEPCGLGQMIAARYGTPPIVRATGGLADTVHEGVNGNGFTFVPFTTAALLAACKRMNKLFLDTKRFTELQRRGMAIDMSWDSSAQKYKNLYQKILTHS